MKTNLFKGILLFSMAALVFTGCEPKEVDQQYIKIKKANYSFLGTGNEPVTVNVEANVKWTVKSDATWVVVSGETESSFVLTAQDNETEFARDTKVVITGANGMVKQISINQLMPDSSTARYRVLSDFTYMAMLSPNGKYAGGYITDVDLETDGWVYLVTIINLETEERHDFGPYPQTMFNFGETAGVSDKGEIYIMGKIGYGSLIIDLEGNTTKFDRPFDWDFYPTITDVAETGGVIGYTTKDAIYTPLEYSPDGIPTALALPEKGYRDEPIFAGGMARSISADGKVIVGTMWEDGDSGLIWWNEAREVAYVGNPTFEPMVGHDGAGQPFTFNLVQGGVEGSIFNCTVSPNGKYIGGMYSTESFDGELIHKSFRACFYNTETGKLTVFEELGDSAGLGATDDGIGFVSTGTQITTSGKVVDIENETVLGTCSEWVLQRYGLNITKGYILGTTKGGEFLFGNIQETSLAGVPDTNTWYIGPPVK